jgi:methyl-accepting chemotaxis protein
VDLSLLYQIGEYFYLVLFAYMAVYLAYFAWPLLSYVGGDTFYEDLDRLGRLIEKAEKEGPPVAASEEDEPEKASVPAENVEERHEELVEELQSIHQDLQDAREKRDELREEGKLTQVSELEKRIIPELEDHFEDLNQKLDALAEEPPTDGTQDEPEMGPDEATVRLENLQLLNAEYRHPFVKDAVSYLRAKFPRAEYQHFEVGPLPSVSEYLERISMARNMAGAFVLLGLLGTMIKLDGVVEQIAGLSRTSEMAPERFLGRMGTLMQGVEGAFFNSILGVMLGVFALVLVGMLNRFVQRRIDRLDYMMSQEVLPGLVRVHNQLMPERTLADLLRGTGKQIDQLDETVDTLRSRMSDTVGTLGDEIEKMLDRFGHYEKHYELINKQVKALDERSENLNEETERLRAQARELANAGDRIAEPIDEMNTTLMKHLDKVSQLQEAEYLQGIIEDIEEAFEADRKARKEELRDILKNNRVDQEQLLQNLREALKEENNERKEHVRDMLEQNTELRRSIQDQQHEVRETLKEQHEKISERLEETTQALKSSSPEQLSRMLEKVNEASDRLNESSKTLSSTAGDMSERLEESSESMQQASQSLDRVARAPTFFAWWTRTAWPTLLGGIYSAIGKDEKAARLRRQIPSNGQAQIHGNGARSDSAAKISAAEQEDTSRT